MVYWNAIICEDKITVLLLILCHISIKMSHYLYTTVDYYPEAARRQGGHMTPVTFLSAGEGRTDHSRLRLLNKDVLNDVITKTNDAVSASMSGIDLGNS